jgi:hypothetical protein
MKAYGGADVEIHIFLTSALVGDEWSASRTCCFTPGGTSPWYPLDRRLGGPQRHFGQYGEVYIPDPIRTRNLAPWSQSLWQVTIPTRLPWLTSF